MAHWDIHPEAVGVDPLSQIAADSLALAEAAAGHFDTRVEHCPDWTMGDLVWHLFEVQSFWRGIVATQASDPDQIERPDQVDDAVLIDAFQDGADRLVGVLAAADPATPLWTWAAQKDAGFVIRHQVQEAAVHRWDAENAAGPAAPIDRATAIDSIEEFLTFSTTVDAAPLGATVAFEATDADAAWTVIDAPPGLSWHRGDSPAAARVRGTASDLLLWLYARVPTADVASGDLALLNRFRSHLSTD